MRLVVVPAGKNVPMDKRKGTQYWEQAAAKGQPDAMAQIGFLYLTGRDGYPLDERRGLDLLQQAVKHGSEYAKNYIAQVRDNRASESRRAEERAREQHQKEMRFRCTAYGQC
jgi:TPR repeat protein